MATKSAKKPVRSAETGLDKKAKKKPQEMSGKGRSKAVAASPPVPKTTKLVASTPKPSKAPAKAPPKKLEKRAEKKAEKKMATAEPELSVEVSQKPSVMAASRSPVAGPSGKKSKKAKDLLDAVEKLSDLGAKWTALYERSQNQKAVTYSMSGQYEPRTALVHKVLGWGYVLSCQNDRLEVLFRDGVRVLISNYKSA